ncbi:MAG: 5-formyltetrahydrofolate cyclo-ligase [Elusimicrobiota bacterium]
MKKNELRNKILEKRRRMDSRELSVISARANEALSSLDLLHDARSVMVYSSFENEVDTWSFIEQTISSKGYVVLPKIKGCAGLAAYKITDISHLVMSGLGIKEPDESVCETVEISDLDLIIVPGVVFGRCGGRIGRGKGYYDNFLKEADGVISIVGLAFDFQVFDKVPQHENDVRMDRIVTEKEIIMCKKHRKENRE